MSGPRAALLEHLGRLLGRARVELDEQVDDDPVVLVLVEAHVREELARPVVAEGGEGQRVAGLRARARLDRPRRRPSRCTTRPTACRRSCAPSGPRSARRGRRGSRGAAGRACTPGTARPPPAARPPPRRARPSRDRCGGCPRSGPAPRGRATSSGSSAARPSVSTEPSIPPESRRARLPAVSETLKLPPAIKACLFDLDGVLTQTAKVHAAAWKQMFDDVPARARRRRRAVRRVRPPRRLRPPTSTAARATTACASFLESRGIDPEEEPRARRSATARTTLVLQLIERARASRSTRARSAS